MAGCAETLPYSEIGRGRQLQYAETFEKSNSMETADVDAAFNACRAYYELRRYGPFFACADTFLKRFSDTSLPSAAQLRVRGKGDFVSPMLVMRASLRLDLGDLPAAAADADRAVEILEAEQNINQLGDTRVFHRAEATSIAGVAHARLGDRAKASQLATRLEGQSGGMIDGVLRRTRNTGVARIHVALGDERKAIEVLERPDGKDAFFTAVDAINKVNPAWYILAPMLTGTIDPNEPLTEQRLKKDYLLNSLYARNGRTAEAAQGFDRLLGEASLPSFGELYWPTLYQRALIFIDSGDIDRAIEHLDAAIQAIEEQRSTIPAEGARIGFSANKQAVYATLVRLLHRRGDLPRAFAVAERGKARALVDTLASRTSFAARGADPVAAARVIAELDQLERTAPAATAGTVTVAARGARRQQIDAVKSRARNEMPELASLVAVETISAADVQQRLQPDEVVLEFYGLGDELFGFAVSKTDLRMERIDTAGLDDAVRQFRAALVRPGDRGYMAAARMLHGKLVQPFAALIGGRALTIVPHGALHYIPFAALHDGGGYLIDRHPIRLLPSASVLRYLRTQPSAAAGTLLALGNPELGDPSMALAGAEAEARAISGAWPGARVLVREQATETIVKRAGGQFRLLHFAVHGEFDPSQPLASRLLLAGDAENDGRLTADELYDLTLDADLVTLSACDTGLGDIASGDDVIGLVRGFLFAGTRSIVASLWPVADVETAELMTGFYRDLAGASRTEALRRAQLAVRGRHPHPFYWAAFQITGAAR